MQRSYIDRFFKKQCIFEKSDLNPYHIPHKNTGKNKRQDKWDDPAYSWPPKYEQSTKIGGLELLNVVNKEEIKKFKDVPKFEKVPVKLGDKIEYEYYMSLTNKTRLKYTGIVIGTANTNSITSSFRVLVNVKGTLIESNYLYYSPMMASIKILNRSYNSRKTKMFNMRNVRFFGSKLRSLLRGGKNLNMTKKIAKQSYKPIENSKNKTIVFEK